MTRTTIRLALALRFDRRAVTSMEYAIIASLASITIVVALTKIGSELTTIFSKVSSEL